MVKIYEEEINEDFEGTIIDIETIGNFNSNFRGDSREYHEIQTIIFGFINKNKLCIYSLEDENLLEFYNEINKIINSLEKPFYAFNSPFEMGVLFNNLDRKIIFDRELNKEKYEAKRTAVKILNISQYDDPFNGHGRLCINKWLGGNKEACIKHNRSCLLKEKDILLKRGFRTPDELIFIGEKNVK